MLKTLTSSVALVGILSFAPTASADDFAPPPWRGGPNHTIQGWEFLTPGNQIPGGSYLVADDPNVPQIWGNGVVPFPAPIPGLGASTADPLATWPDTVSWTVGDGDGQIGTTFTTAPMVFWCPNWIDNEPLKWLRIQVTFDGPPPLLGPILGGFGNDPLNVIPGVAMTPPVIVDANHYYQDWQIEPNPHWERIGMELLPGTLLDEVIIDTISFTIPEPTTTAVLAIGATLLMRRRR